MKVNLIYRVAFECLAVEMYQRFFVGLDLVLSCVYLVH